MNWRHLKTLTVFGQQTLHVIVVVFCAVVFYVFVTNLHFIVVDVFCFCFSTYKNLAGILLWITTGEHITTIWKYKTWTFDCCQHVSSIKQSICRIFSRILASVNIQPVMSRDVFKRFRTISLPGLFLVQRKRKDPGNEDEFQKAFDRLAPCKLLGVVQCMFVCMYFS